MGYSQLACLVCVANFYLKHYLKKVIRIAHCIDFCHWLILWMFTGFAGYTGLSERFEIDG